MARFDYFVVFAEMRTGSNLLEANINRFADLACHGEAFNPNFVGYPKTDNVLGITISQREADPYILIDAIKKGDGLSGFRFFRDHDPRIPDICLNDPRCAKIVLTRNPIDSFVSLNIAKATGQWKLTNATHAKVEKVTFDPQAFAQYLSEVQGFRQRILRSLQKTGQTAFYLCYEDLADIDVINGLGQFLGANESLKSLDRKLKKQNPQPILEKVRNADEMSIALAKLDHFGLQQPSNFEPSRGPMSPAYVAAANAGLLYMPLRSAIDDRICDWLAAVDDAPRKALQTGLSRKTLREWQRNSPCHRSFAVLTHPIARAHYAFSTHILFAGPRNFPNIRQSLRKVHNLPIPRDPVQPGNLGRYDLTAHRTAFAAFLRFLKHNLSAQTGIRTDPAWASQLTILQGMASLAPPDMILREDRLAADLKALASQVDLRDIPSFSNAEDMQASLLREIYDAELEALARDAYLRDYETFGFSAWRCD